MIVLGCMHALLLATANTELDGNGRTALQHGAAKAQGHTASASRNWQHAAPPHQPAPASPAAAPDAREAAMSAPASLKPPHSLLKVLVGEPRHGARYRGGALPLDFGKSEEELVEDELHSR